MSNASNTINDNVVSDNVVSDNVVSDNAPIVKQKADAAILSSFRLLALTGASALKEALSMFGALPPSAREDVAITLLGDRATQALGERLDLYSTHEKALRGLDDNAKISCLNALYTLKAKGFDATLRVR